MTRIAIVSYPVLADPHAGMIESIRTAHDPQARLIRAHFTLVFPVSAAPSEVISETVAACATAARIHFSACKVCAARDDTGPGGHVFLIPDAGSGAIIDLHDRLYAGRLRPALRADIPYVPHITLAAKPDFEECLRLAARLDAEGGVIEGALSSLEVIAVHADRVETLAPIPLCG